MHAISPELLARHDYKIPNFIASSIETIDFAVLAERGITHVLVDVDNTLVSFGRARLHLGAVRHLRAARQQHLIETLAIATNSRRRLTAIADALEPTAVFQPRGLMMKPRRGYYEYILRQLGCRPETTVMIGDKLVQDVWGARRAGLTTILVKPVGQDLWLDRICAVRWREKRLLRGYLPRHHEHWF